MSQTSPPCPACGEVTTQPDVLYGSLGLIRCFQCRFLFLPPQLIKQTEQLYTQEYVEHYQTEDPLQEREQREHEASIRLDHLQPLLPAGGSILEFGPAAGWFLHGARLRGFQGVGVEPLPSFAQHARERLGLEVCCASLEQIGREGLAKFLPPSSKGREGVGPFDAVVGFHVLEHLAEPRPAVQLMGELLKPGGVLMLEVPNISSAVAQAEGLEWHALDLPYHLGHYSPDALDSLLSSCGLEVSEVRTLPTAHYVRYPGLKQALTAREALRARLWRVPPEHPYSYQLLQILARKPA